MDDIEEVTALVQKMLRLDDRLYAQQRNIGFTPERAEALAAQRKAAEAEVRRCWPSGRLQPTGWGCGWRSRRS